jgi:hypothetical protein
MHVNGENVLDITIAEQFNTVVHFLDKTGFYELLQTNFASTWKSFQIVKVHNAVNFLEYISEPTFWDPALQGHLAALEPRGRSAARARFLTFMPTPGCFAESRSCSTSNTLSAMLRSRKRS